MRRHIGFQTPDDARNHFLMDTPRHAYYSTAFYRDPAAPKMEGKEWLGAELVFDLDADHIPGAEEMTYEQQLTAVKREVIKLLEKYVLDSFGFDEKHVDLVFSGGRGYHIHVNDPRVYKLGSKERREIVDYITGTGLDEGDESWLFPRRPLDKRTFRGRTKVRFIREMPRSRDPGWKGILAGGIEMLLSEWELSDRPTALKSLRQLVRKYELQDGSGRNYGNSTQKKLYDELFGGPSGSRGVDKIRKGTFEVFSEDRSRDFFMKLAKHNASVTLAGETDQPVTTDTHRLIRVPGSLHGKTGFQVFPIDIDHSKRFDPLRDAVVLPPDEVTVECIRATDIGLKGRRYSIGPGTHELPGYVAAFLIASGAALLPREGTG